MVRWCGGEMVYVNISTLQHYNINISTSQNINTPTYLSLYSTPSVAYTGYMVCSIVLNFSRNTPDIPHCTSAYAPKCCEKYQSAPKSKPKCQWRISLEKS